MLVYIYISFIILQLALFNLIMLGVMFVYFKKLYFFFHSLEFRFDSNFRNTPLKKYIETENERFYRKKNIELVGGEEGLWLELQLPDDIEDRQNKDQISMQLGQSDMKVNNSSS